MTPAIRAVPAATAHGSRVHLRHGLVEELRNTGDQETAGVRGRPDDQRVQRNDVGHREERDESTSHFLADGGTTTGDVEEAIK